MKIDKNLEKILSGLSDKNIWFDDLRKVLLKHGFSERINGSHHIFYRNGIVEIINLQSLRDSKSKAYQVKQVRNLFLKYRLHEEAQNERTN